jgi:WhiB family transcriptional regulator, redox-sensing transcriptional regulator
VIDIGFGERLHEVGGDGPFAPNLLGVPAPPAVENVDTQQVESYADRTIAEMSPDTKQIYERMQRRFDQISPAKLDTQTPAEITPVQTTAGRTRNKTGTWFDEAACLGADPRTFYPEGNTKIDVRRTVVAKSVCARCPVRVECLDYARTNKETFGIWGGESEEERRI